MKSFAPGIAVVVLLAVAAFIFLPNDDALKGSSTVNSTLKSPVAEPAGLSPEINSAASGTITPLASPLTSNGISGGNGPVAPMLADLVGGLEAKVKTDPANIGNQILLAQTYSELGRTDEGIVLLRKAALTNVEAPRVNVVLASLLSKSNKSDDLTAALKLLNDATKADAGQVGIAELYRGRIYVAQGKKEAAIKTWEAALKRIPATDNARVQLEEELAKTK